MIRKKLPLVFAVLILFTTLSCSNDSEEMDVAPAKTIKKIILKEYLSGSLVDENNYIFTYQNNQVHTIINGTKKSDYFYSGDKIVEIKNYDSDVLHSNILLEYNGNLLESVLHSTGYKTEFTYSNGVLLSSADSHVSSSTPFFEREYLFDANGNITQSIISNSFSGTYSSYKYTYTYDNFNNALKNMNPYFRLLTNINSLSPICVNNQIIVYSFDNVNSTTPNLSNSNNNVIDYDADQFPIKIRQYRGQGNSNLVSEATIEYN